jgi:hypothetical protein
MNRREVRCFRGLASIPGQWNVEVDYTVPDFGYHNKLFSCIECGERFVIDMNNPAIAGRPVAEIVGDDLCPRCARTLAQSISDYPETFRTPDGKVGHMQPPRIAPPDSESYVKEFFEIHPKDGVLRGT